jgi:predicted transcriptional regulator
MAPSATAAAVIEYSTPDPIPRVPEAAAEIPEVRGAAAPRGCRKNHVTVSVRLDPDRHGKLAHMAAHRGSNRRTLMLEALTSYLEQAAPWPLNGECCCLLAAADAGGVSAAPCLGAGRPVAPPSAAR